MPISSDNQYGISFPSPEEANKFENTFRMFSKAPGPVIPKADTQAVANTNPQPYIQSQPGLQNMNAAAPIDQKGLGAGPLSGNNTSTNSSTPNSKEILALRNELAALQRQLEVYIDQRVEQMKQEIIAVLRK